MYGRYTLSRAVNEHNVPKNECAPVTYWQVPTPEPSLVTSIESAASSASLLYPHNPEAPYTGNAPVDSSSLSFIVDALATTQSLRDTFATWKDISLSASDFLCGLLSQRSALVDTYIKDANSRKSNQTIISLGNYGSFVRGLTYSSVDVTDDTSKTGVVRSNNLEYGSPVDTTSNLVYVNKNPALEQRLVKGDIVICMANGSSSLVGKASYYQGGYDNMTVGAFCGIYRGNHPLAKWIFMSSAYCKAVANAIQGGNGAIANLHGEDILSMNFVVPSDQNRTTALYQLLNLYDSKIQIAEEELAGFIEQKSFFLCKMFI